MKRAIFTLVMLVLMSGIALGVRDFEDTLISNQGINAQSFDYSTDNPDFESRNSQKEIYTITSGTINADSNCSWVTVIDRDGTDGGHLTVELDSCIVYEYTVYTRAQFGGTGHMAYLEAGDIFIEWDEDPGHGSKGDFSFDGGYVEETPSYVQVTGIGSTNWTVYRVTSAGELIKTEDCCVEHDAIHLSGCFLTLEKFDDVNDGDCVGQRDEIMYTISYSNPVTDPCNPCYIGTVNDVNIIDYLPDDVKYLTSDPCGIYDSNSHTVGWNIGTLSPGDGCSATVIVKVNECILGCGIISNFCEIKSGDLTLNGAYEDTPVCCASNPSPTCGATVDLDVGEVNLIWCPGLWVADVNGHEVYFGTDYNDVNDANVNDVDVYKGTVTNPSYPLPFTSLDAGTTYYWRIDEVNTNHPDARWRGGVWSFTTGNCLVVEDFESYMEDDTLRSVWEDYYTGNGTSAEVGLESAIVHEGSKSMRYWYRNNLAPFYSESWADTADLPSSIGSDWTADGVKALALHFYGKADNDANEQMYAALTDGDGSSHTATVVYDGDMNDIKKEEWQEWDIRLKDFSEANDVNLANVSRITIGFGDGTDPGGSGTVYFDDIWLCLSRCVLSRRSADFAKLDYAPAGAPAGDCVIDYREIEVMGGDWLMTPPPDPNVDLYGDGTIDFRDFAALAKMWLTEELWPFE